MTTALSPMLAMQDAQLVAKWDSFLRDYCMGDLRAVALSYPERQSLFVPFNLVQLRDPDLANHLLRRPAQALRMATQAASLIELPVDPAPKIRVRVCGLPDALRLTPRRLRSEHVGTLVAVRGIVTASSPPLLSLLEGCFECKVCTTRVRVIQDEEARTDPVFCETCDAQRPWRFVEEESSHTDLQVLRLQDIPEDLEGGQSPEIVSVYLKDDLANDVQPGARILVVAIMVLKFRRSNGKPTVEAEPVLHAVSIQQDATQAVDLDPTPHEEALFRDLAARSDAHQELAKCVAPSVLGLEVVKTGILYALAGSPDVVRLDGSRTRGRIHVLVVGDPGIAKSKVLGLVPQYVPRCITVFGLNANKTGLGAGVIKDEASGQWMIQPGALVLAHGHVILIDELGLIDPEDRPALNSSMEEGKVQQTKIKQAELPAAPTVIAAMNPMTHRFDPYSPFIEQLGLHPALRSRFDLVFCLRDTVDERHDRELARHQLQQHPVGVDVRQHYGILMDGGQLRKYLHLARGKNPCLTPEASQHLQAYYERVRQSDRENPPFTPRQLDGLHRLARASARLRLSDSADVGDAQRAIDLMAASLRSAQIMDTAGRVDASLLQVGASRAQADRVKLVLQFVKDLQRSHPKGYNQGWANEEDVVEAALKVGVEQADTKRTLHELVRTSVIYQRGGGGHYAVLSG